MGLTEYTLKRLLMLVPTLLIISLICFLLIRMIPGDPAQLMLGDYFTAEDLDRMRKLMGLDQPIHVQYLIYLQRLIRGDWGTSLTTRLSVLPLLIRRLEATFELTTFTLIISSVVGMTLGSLSALKKDSVIDHLCRGLAIGFFSIPIFWLGLMLILVFSLYLGLLPSMGRGGIEYLILPGVTLSAWCIGPISRITKVSILDVLHQDFVVLIRAKGLTEKAIIFKHVLRNALIPIVTVIGLQFGSLLAGAIMTESVFNYPGMGLLLIEYLFKRDYPVIQGGILLAASLFCLINLCVDLLYGFLDPRTRLVVRAR